MSLLHISKQIITLDTSPYYSHLSHCFHPSVTLTVLTVKLSFRLLHPIRIESKEKPEIQSVKTMMFTSLYNITWDPFIIKSQS